jgi:transposase-like protein
MNKLNMKEFKSILEFQKHFDTDEKCREHLEQSRWNGTPACPHCGSINVCRFKTGKQFNCRDCRKNFSATVGTIYENSKIPLSKWYLATYILTNHSKGISSLQLAKWLGCTQKTAWFLNHRIREMLKETQPELLSTECEADESFIGGSVTNWSNKKRKEYVENGKNWQQNKTMVLGVVERGKSKIVERPHKVIKGKTVKEKIIEKESRVHTKVVKSVTIEELKTFIIDNVEEGAILYTDELAGYKHLATIYKHTSVNHSSGQYKVDNAHTNTIEGFWSLLKRQIVGIHHSISEQHLERYSQESAYRYNRRKLTQDEKFEDAVKKCNRRLKYNALIQKNIKRG